MTLDKPGIPEKLNTPEKRAQFAADVYLKTKSEGIPKNVVAEHGTSVQVLKHWILTGILPGRSEDSEGHLQGDLFVKINPDAIPNRKNPSSALQNLYPPHQLSDISIEAYAEINARKDYIMEKLRIPLSEQDMVAAIQHFIVGDEIQALEDEHLKTSMRRLLHNLPPGVEIEDLVEESQSRHGVRFGIRREAITRNPDLNAISIGDTAEGDTKLMLGDKGLNIRYLGSIVFGSPRDAEDFAEFLKQFNLV